MVGEWLVKEFQISITNSVPQPLSLQPAFRHSPPTFKPFFKAIRARNLLYFLKVYTIFSGS